MSNSRGFMWFAQNNNTTDYVELSVKLAKSIKQHSRNKNANICVITDEKSKFTNDNIDLVKVLNEDESAEHEIKWANEYKSFALSPFTHTIKLEADMLWTINTDWWWYYLWQHDLVFSVDCKDYRDGVVKDTKYRQLFIKNNLPNIYNGLMYFRRSKRAHEFFTLAEHIVKNWKQVKNNMLLACHDPYPSTDVVFALAYRIMDPTMQHLIDYEWFKFIHHKPGIHNLERVQDHNQYLYPNTSGNALFLGEKRVSRVWHYHDKELNVRSS